MTHNESPQFSEFDVMTAPVEIEMVTDELGTMELVMREYPRLHSIYQKNKYDLLESPATHFTRSEKIRILTKANLPTIAKLIYGDEDE